MPDINIIDLNDFINDKALHEHLKTELVIHDCAGNPTRIKEMVDMLTRNQNFFDLLCVFIDRAGLDEVRFYQKSGISAAVFSNMRRPEHASSKETVIKSAIGLGLDFSYASMLLEKAGYAFVWTQRRDLAIIYCIMNEIYNTMEVDNILINVGEPVMFSVN